MNVRHLEIFCHVVRHSGIVRAAGQKPFGIQQPAISEQIQLLEVSLHCRLFDRDPFRLTPEGHRLYLFARDFFEALAPMAAQLRCGLRRHIRIGAEEMLVQNYLSIITRKLTSLEPSHTFSFSSAPLIEMEQWLRVGAVDLILALSGKEVPKKFTSKKIAALPLVLLVDQCSQLRSADELWTATEITHPLICTGIIDAVAQSFQRGLKQGGIIWRTSTTVGSVASVQSFVAGSNGVGVSLDAPYLGHSAVRALPLKGFDPVQVSALWMSSDTPRLKTLVRCIRSTAQLFSHVQTPRSFHGSCNGSSGRDVSS